MFNVMNTAFYVTLIAITTAVVLIQLKLSAKEKAWSGFIPAVLVFIAISVIMACVYSDVYSRNAAYTIHEDTFPLGNNTAVFTVVTDENDKVIEYSDIRVKNSSGEVLYSEYVHPGEDYYGNTHLPGILKKIDDKYHLEEGSSSVGSPDKLMQYDSTTFTVHNVLNRAAATALPLLVIHLVIRLIKRRKRIKMEMNRMNIESLR